MAPPWLMAVNRVPTTSATRTERRMSGRSRSAQPKQTSAEPVSRSRWKREAQLVPQRSHRMDSEGATTDGIWPQPAGMEHAVSNSAAVRRPPRRSVAMLWTIFVVLLVLWALGLVSSYTLGGYIHILLVVAIAVVLIRIIQGRRPV